MKRKMTSLTGYVYEEALCREANSKGRNYWYKYLEEIFDEMGLRAEKITRPDMLDKGLLSQLKILFIGSIDLSLGEKACLREWVAAGGTLAAFAAGQADDLFGFEYKGQLRQPDDGFTISGYCRIDAEQGCSADHLYDYKGTLLPILSDLKLINATGGKAIGAMFNAGKWITGYDALVTNGVGQGKTYYFAFDFAQTIWVMHQGRPVNKDHDGDGFYRYADAIVLGRSLELEYPYADYYLQFLERILAQVPQPFLHQLPAFEDGSVPDMVFHIGGDDECTPGIQLKASRYMKEKGLPYQMNLMPTEGEFAIGMDEFNEIKANGHDLSLHFDFVKPLTHFTELDVRTQLEQYLETFAEMPAATVNHWGMATGWAEQARWCSRLGMLGDNSRHHSFIPPNNPVNKLGFGFGTAYPYFAYDDFEHENTRISYVFMTMAFFEPRIYEDTRMEDVKRIHSAVDRAAYFRWTLNIFLHPIYIADDNNNRNSLPALDAILSYIRIRHYKPLYYSTRQMCLWWHGRSASTVEFRGMEKSGSTDVYNVKFKVHTAVPQGVLVKLPVPAQYSGNIVYSTGRGYGKCTVQEQNGRLWAVCHAPAGVHDVEVKFE